MEDRPCVAQFSDGEECGCARLRLADNAKRSLCKTCGHRAGQHPELNVPEETVSSIVEQVKSKYNEKQGLALAERESRSGMRTKAPSTQPSHCSPRSPSLCQLSPKAPLSRHHRSPKAPESPQRPSFFGSMASLSCRRGPISGKVVGACGQGNSNPSGRCSQDVVDLFSQHLPKPMAYFDSLGETSFSSGDGEKVNAPMWVLLARRKQAFQVVPVVQPQALDLSKSRVVIGTGAAVSRYIVICEGFSNCFKQVKQTHLSIQRPGSRFLRRSKRNG
ncbi:hypothetical protein FB45DRAFT_919244 [Roridomyces roridus]|uniref:Uncharacterized protein n=1 Tax=Roridomyces roridus TaxID=1738132 RepID=A0AAD7BRQ4_9AGAR|nr:hypothetical protein FB45DRAFT_919244 [Roridomyces roridus]